MRLEGQLSTSGEAGSMVGCLKVGVKERGERSSDMG